ncbi:OsmC family protein [Echinimonas agarilytica]|uniref:OsmC family protein n=1 Tax=Echinimonas agarilytica TaxID=1215918 RepID=A0AA41W521_9GAMM|nr:OsmC family protein [Echinimonas agarilytica]MCM2679021.1 OsmC family protein [Echinimonas agarilytica]
MADYTAVVTWQKKPDEVFSDHTYSRAHVWEFDGGLTVAASSSPHVVPLPYSVEANVDPEEAFVASISSCHMLFFLSIAAKRKWTVQRYYDQPVGVMAKNQSGKMAMTQLTLRPKIEFVGESQPSLEQLQTMHHQAHEQCFIANSVTTQIVTEIVL